jgi:hypothetical protein
MKFKRKGDTAKARESPVLTNSPPTCARAHARARAHAHAHTHARARARAHAQETANFKTKTGIADFKTKITPSPTSKPFSAAHSLQAMPLS